VFVVLLCTKLVDQNHYLCPWIKAVSRQVESFFDKSELPWFEQSAKEYSALHSFVYARKTSSQTEDVILVAERIIDEIENSSYAIQTRPLRLSLLPQSLGG
jgi:hypothetical protein